MKKTSSFGLFGIVGSPLSHTLSPRMQEAAFEHAGLKAFYAVLEFNPENFRNACRHLNRWMVDGFNVTVPYKQAILPFLDQVTPEARAVGAVNTVFKKNGRWIGTNTDVYGFSTSLKEEGRFQPKGKTALVLGAGGAARAVLYALAVSGVKEVQIANRSAGKALRLKQAVQKLFPKTVFKTVSSKEALPEALKKSDLVVNATSLGLKASDPAVISAGDIPRAGKKKKLFFDLIYHVPQTAFMKAAHTRGHKTLNGLGMLLFQGAAAFEIWTQKKAPVNVMRQALLSGLKGHSN